jgi:hypothetical protein
MVLPLRIIYVNSDLLLPPLTVKLHIFLATLREHKDQGNDTDARNYHSALRNRLFTGFSIDTRWDWSCHVHAGDYLKKDSIDVRILLRNQI